MQAEVTPPAPVAAKAFTAMKAKGRGKGRGKTAKAKAKARAAKVAARAAGGEEGAEEVRKPKLNLKAQIMSDIGNRDIDEVLAEARKKVTDSEGAIGNAETEAQKKELEAESARKDMEAASAKVEETSHKEAIALAKLKAARQAKNDAAANAAGTRAGKVNSETTLRVLELEVESQAKLKDLQEARKAAGEAVEAAKLVIVESKLKEKEALNAVKKVYAEQALKEVEAMKESASAAAGDKQAQKDAKFKGKADSKVAHAEMSAIEKARADREKDRQFKLREATGIGKGKKPRMGLLALGAPSPAKAAGVASKATRIMDVD